MDLSFGYRKSGLGWEVLDLLFSGIFQGGKALSMEENGGVSGP